MELKQPILAKYVGATIAGLAPRIMGIGPTLAVPKLLNKYGLTLEDIDLIELNEAFASMAVYCRDTLKLDWSKMNARGGAIALGHPFGCTGVRQIVTGLSECRRRKVKILLTTMCLGTGRRNAPYCALQNIGHMLTVLFFCNRYGHGRAIRERASLAVFLCYNSSLHHQ